MNRDLPLLWLPEGISSGAIWSRMTDGRLRTTSTVPNFQLFGPDTRLMANSSVQTLR